MRLYKPTFKDKRGKTKEVKRWWIELTDKREKRFRRVLRLPALEEEGLSRTLGDKVAKLINHAAINEPDPDLLTWFENYAPKKLQERLSDIGLLLRSTRDADKPLLDYLPDFQQAVYQESKSDKKKKTTTADISAKTFAARVRKLIKACGFETWRDVSSEKVNDYIESRPDGMSQQTAHFYVQSFRRFAKWMLEQGYADKMLKINSVSVPTNPGRLFELDEFERLLEAARTGPERYGLSGSQRYLLYLLAVETGLRRGELKSLIVASIDFKNSCVFVKGGVDGATKNKDEAVQHFTPETGALLKEHVKGKMPNVQLFKIHDRSSKMIAEDCKAAGIEVANHKGKLLFHSLRHTCGSYLSAQGVVAIEVQGIMRHKDIRLTMGRYGHILDGRAQEAVNKLPRFARPNVKGKTA
jgi:integrase